MNFKANIERVVKAKATVNDGVNAKASASVYTDVGDYNALANKPQINGVTLEGNKSDIALGLVTDDDLLHLNDDGESYKIRRVFRQNYNGIELAWTMYGADEKVLALPSLQGVNSMIADKITADDLPKITVDNVRYNINGYQKYTDSVGIEGIKAEVLLHALEDKGIYVSSGSACSSNHPGLSDTLTAIGVDKPYLDSTIRFSLSRFTTREELAYTIEVLQQLLPTLRRFTKR